NPHPLVPRRPRMRRVQPASRLHAPPLRIALRRPHPRATRPRPLVPPPRAAEGQRAPPRQRGLRAADLRAREPVAPPLCTLVAVCGICGIVAPGRPPEADVVEAMSA